MRTVALHDVQLAVVASSFSADAVARETHVGDPRSAAASTYDDESSHTPSYYRTILARAYAVNPILVADEALFQALLLVLIAKQKHLIVRTAEEDVQRVLKQVVAILHTLFNLSVVKVKLRQSDKLLPDDFLRLLFLENSLGLTSRTSSRRTLSGAGNHANLFKRSSSYPTTTSANIAAVDESYNYFQSNGLDSGLRPPIHSVMYRERQGLMRAQTDPMPPIQHDEDARRYETGSKLLPQVLAVSGIEHTSEHVQCALWTAMSERWISLSHNHQRHDAKSHLSEGGWPLPDDFFVVYVCPTGEGHERPAIHKSLIDRFAMSVEVYPSVENVFDNRLPSSLPKDTDVALSKPILSALEVADLRLLASPAHTFINDKLDLYLSDLISAARHHPHLDGMLLTVRCRAETVQLLRAWRVLFGAAPDGEGHLFLTLDVTEEDVWKVFVRAVQHRLRVLDGPRHEILSSLIFRAAGDAIENTEWESGRRTVKDILREIIDTV
ncbi:hypothetical protein DFH11DRAFT_1781874 [Phellopilus nigrolimitatus]|nr:hypothetical protein DFH11DRAFT_1781874 [Phellopilus nigrolimitatus]